MTLRKSLVAAIAALTPFVATSAIAASLTVGFSQIGSESGWRAAQPLTGDYAFMNAVGCDGGQIDHRR